MEIITARIPQNANIYVLSDSHIGSALFYEKGFDRAVKIIKDDPIGYACHLGDVIEAIATDDKRFTLDASKEPIPLRQANLAVEKLLPIKEKILFILLGNHEYKLHRYGNLTQHICSQLGVPYGSYTCKVTFKDEDKFMFKGFFTHGFRTINSIAYDPEQAMGAMKKRLKDLLMKKAGDCVIMGMGHTHKLIVREPSRQLYLVDDGKEIRQKYTTAGEGDYIHPDMRWYFNAGSFFKLYGANVTSYSEVFGYDPAELGYIKIKVRDGSIQDVKQIVI